MKRKSFITLMPDRLSADSDDKALGWAGADEPNAPPGAAVIKLSLS
jgi:hypothetical protein